MFCVSWMGVTHGSVRFFKPFLPFDNLLFLPTAMFATLDVGDEWSKSKSSWSKCPFSIQGASEIRVSGGLAKRVDHGVDFRCWPVPLPSRLPLPEARQPEARGHCNLSQHFNSLSLSLSAHDTTPSSAPQPFRALFSKKTSQDGAQSSGVRFYLGGNEQTC